jgi:hypothetical protein
MFGYNRIKIMGEDIGIMSRTYQMKKALAKGHKNKGNGNTNWTIMSTRGKEFYKNNMSPAKLLNDDDFQQP